MLGVQSEAISHQWSSHPEVDGFIQIARLVLQRRLIASESGIV